jgi:hypothetical protein
MPSFFLGNVSRGLVSQHNHSVGILFLQYFWRILIGQPHTGAGEHCMKTIILIPLLVGWIATGVAAQERIYRCGNEYTNTVSEAQARNCKLISGGNVTVVPAQKSSPASATRVASSGQPGQRVDAGEQRAKDSDAKLILESELKKAEARQAELLKEYNNGEPEKLGGEARNFQKYLDRVAELKAGISRNESDIAGIRRELGRAPANSTASSAAKP